MKQLTANELRIGNVFNYGAKEAGIFKPTIIDWSDIRLAAEYPKEFNVLYHRIPLTEDVLLRFWYKKKSDFYYCPDASTRLVLTKSDLGYWFELGYDTEDQKTEWNMLTDVQFSHQLQNLYFALTGHELEFKPE